MMKYSHEVAAFLKVRLCLKLIVLNIYFQKHKGPPNAAKALGITQVPVILEKQFKSMNITKTPTEEKVSKLKQKKIAIIEETTHVIPKSVRLSKLIGK